MKILIVLSGLMSTALIAGPQAGDCSQILREYNGLAQQGEGRVLLSSTENAMGTRLMQMEDYGAIKYLETPCAPSGGQTVCSGMAVISSLRTAAGQPFDPAARESQAFKIDAQARLLVRSGSASFFQPLTLTQCHPLPQGAFIRAQAANAREASLYHILFRRVP